VGYEKVVQGTWIDMTDGVCSWKWLHRRVEANGYSFVYRREGCPWGLDRRTPFLGSGFAGRIFAIVTRWFAAGLGTSRKDRATLHRNIRDQGQEAV
jgi:hypothetical protein